MELLLSPTVVGGRAFPSFPHFVGYFLFTRSLVILLEGGENMRNVLFDFVAFFDGEVQEDIREDVHKTLHSMGYRGDELEGYVETAMNGKLIDLEDTIDINRYANY